MWFYFLLFSVSNVFTESPWLHVALMKSWYFVSDISDLPRTTPTSLRFFLVLSGMCVCVLHDLLVSLLRNSLKWLCSPNLSAPTPAGKTRQLFRWREGGRWWDTWCSSGRRRTVTTPYCRHHQQWSEREKTTKVHLKQASNMKTEISL